MASLPDASMGMEAGESARELPTRSWASRIAGSWALRGFAMCAATLAIVRFSFHDYALEANNEPIYGIPGRNQLQIIDPRKVTPGDKDPIYGIPGRNQNQFKIIDPTKVKERKKMTPEDNEPIYGIPGRNQNHFKIIDPTKMMPEDMAANTADVPVNEQMEGPGFPDSMPPGSDEDAHGCIGSAGYRFCPHSHECHRSWEVKCKGGFEGDVHCAASHRAFPPAWGTPPQCKPHEDLETLPAGAGTGCGALKDWIQLHLNADVGFEASASTVTHYAPNEQAFGRPAFPQSWSSPPEYQTRDSVDLPGGFGKGSSTLQTWIQDHITEDKEKNEDSGKANTFHHAPSGKAYPRLWEAPPQAQTMDYVQLPCKFGSGSSTEKEWIERHMDYDLECGTDERKSEAFCSSDHLEDSESDGLPRTVAF